MYNEQLINSPPYIPTPPHLPHLPTFPISPPSPSPHLPHLPTFPNTPTPQYPITRLPHYSLMLLLDISFAIVKDNQWYPEIGDPTFLGWFTVIAYLLTAVLAIISTVNTSHLKLSAKQLENHRLIWGLIALILLFLGINKQLDLQTWLTVTSKNLALAEGWYDQRRIVQAIFILSIAIFGLIFLAFLFWLMKDNHTNARWGLIGLGILTCFVVIRAASFHHVDQLIGLNFVGIRVNNILELGGISAIAFSALKNVKISS